MISYKIIGYLSFTILTCLQSLAADDERQRLLEDYPVSPQHVINVNTLPLTILPQDVLEHLISYMPIESAWAFLNSFKGTGKENIFQAIGPAQLQESIDYFKLSDLNKVEKKTLLDLFKTPVVMSYAPTGWSQQALQTFLKYQYIDSSLWCCFRRSEWVSRNFETIKVENLRSLTLVHSLINRDTIKAATTLIKVAPNLEFLNISSNFKELSTIQLGQFFWEELLQFEGNFAALTHFVCQNNKGALQDVHLIAFLHKTPNLEILNIDRNEDIFHESFYVLYNDLVLNKLRRLSCEDTDIFHAKGPMVLVENVYFPSLSYLSFNKIELEEYKDPGQNILTVVTKFDSLKQLNIRNNKLGDQFFKLLVNRLIETQGEGEDFVFYLKSPIMLDIQQNKENTIELLNWLREKEDLSINKKDVSSLIEWVKERLPEEERITCNKETLSEPKTLYLSPTFILKIGKKEKKNEQNK